MKIIKCPSCGLNDWRDKLWHYVCNGCNRAIEKALTNDKKKKVK